jgi:hypothetical protein
MQGPGALPALYQIPEPPDNHTESFTDKTAFDASGIHLSVVLRAQDRAMTGHAFPADDRTQDCVT